MQDEELDRLLRALDSRDQSGGNLERAVWTRLAAGAAQRTSIVPEASLGAVLAIGFDGGGALRLTAASFAVASLAGFAAAAMLSMPDAQPPPDATGWFAPTGLVAPSTVLGQ